MKIEIFDVELGQCAMVHCPNGEKVMVDAGHNASRPWFPSLHFYGAKIEKLVVTNFDEDHVSNYVEMHQHCSVRTVLLNQSVSATELFIMKRATGGMGKGISAIHSLMQASANLPNRGIIPNVGLGGVEMTHYYLPFGAPYKELVKLNLLPRSAEMDEHAKTHCAPRLRKVVDGEQGGISEAVGWKGGGGFRFYHLAPSLLEKDRWDNWVIAQTYNPTMLAEAVCKLMGFAYAPSDQFYWLHGKSSETDFIYVTTQCLTHEQLRAISEEVGDERSLLVCCKAFSSTNLEAFPIRSCLNFIMIMRKALCLEMTSWQLFDLWKRMSSVGRFARYPLIR